MMYCSKCGKKIDDDAAFCKYCGRQLSVKNDKRFLLQYTIPKGIISRDKIKKYKKYLFIGIFVIVALIYVFVIRCKAGLCPLPSSLHSEYCSVHTCDKSGCYNKVAKGKNYCYTHMPFTSALTNYNYTPEVAEDVLVFSDIDVSKNSSYTVCTATITNNGRKTYTFIEVKGKFKDSSGTILDTDWTYAVGSEGLAPGESATFRLSVSKNTNILTCELEILDYNKK